MPEQHDILERLAHWYERVPFDSALFGCSSKLLDDAAAEITQLRAELAAAIKQRDEAIRERKEAEQSLHDYECGRDAAND